MAAHSLEILKVIEETSDAISIVFDVSCAGDFTYLPGQFLTLHIPGSPEVSRCYSLSSAPGLDSNLQVTVKRTVAGYASNWLCDNAVPGMRLSSRRPSGRFTPKRWDVDLVLAAAGSGITPVMSILRTALAEHGNRVRLLYANRNADATIFSDQLSALEARYRDRLTVIHWLESDSGLPIAAELEPLFGDVTSAEAFLCGPAPFMEIAAAALAAKGLDSHLIHKEQFVSLSTEAFEVAPADSVTGAATATVDIDGEEHTVAWPRESVLLDVLLAKGIDAPYVCREGNCGGCAYTLRTGEVSMRVNDALDEYELDHGVRLACQSIPVTDEIEIAFDR